MLHFSPFKTIAIGLLCLLALIAAIPNFFDKATVQSWPSVLPSKQISLGLDLRGGAHLLLAMNVDELKADMRETLVQDARVNLRDAKIAVSAIGIRDENVLVRLRDRAQTDEAMQSLRKLVEQVNSALLGGGGNNIEITQAANGLIQLNFTEVALRQRITDAIGAAIETVRRRVDPAGNIDASITRNGADRILVQVPGVDDTADIKRRIGETAKLSFHEVHPDETAGAGPTPPGFASYPSVEQQGYNYLLRRSAVVQGDDLVDAQPGFDQRTNEPIISFRFNQAGARKFGKWTSENVGRPFAIVLDGQVLSAPVVREPILGGSGQISGSFTPQTANDLAINLKSGALPATLTVIEERTVGPTLGADSIQSGLMAFAIGALATIAFTILVYGTFGIIAVAGLFVNAVLLIAVMSQFGSTLTLPGIAGLVLTIGMAVDANVLIYERIREELRNGKSAVAAIDTGFSRAMVTIIDSQLTTLAAAIIMFWLGAGPIRGFAVTLSIGIFTSVFTAVTVVRLMVALWLRAEREKTRAVEVPI